MNRYCVILFFSTIYGKNAMADNFSTEKIGLGIGSGTTTSALTAKKYLQSDKAIQFFFGTKGINSNHNFALGLDGVIEKPIQEISIGQIFYGFGAGCGIFSYNGFGLPISSIGFSGIAEFGLHFSTIPLELILDIRPTLFLGSGAGLSLFGGGGAIRWYF